jgi:hypothetical protein
MPEVKNIKGRRFGKLLVLSQVKKRSNDRHARWLCLCNCGMRKRVQGHSLRSGRSRSCGCQTKIRRLAASLKHGYSRKGKVTPEYRAYTGAKDRCRKDAKAHEAYFDRGIKFKFSSFAQFIKEVGNRPSSKYSLDRRGNNGHYEPRNVRWATASEQQKNKGSRYKEKIVVLERKIKSLERALIKCSQSRRA